MSKVPDTYFLLPLMSMISKNQLNNSDSQKNLMTRNTIIGLLSILVVTSTLSPIYAEFISPAKQLNDGVEPTMIQCNDGKILMMSAAGKPACVKENTAKKLESRGWISIVLQETMDKSNLVEKDIAFADTVDLTSNTDDFISNDRIIESSNSKENIPQELPIKSSQIPNPDGYWTPIVDRDTFANRFLDAINDEIIEIKVDGNYRTTYVTESGFLKLFHYHFTQGNGVVFPIIYSSTNTIHDRQEQLQFINNFMNEMNLKFAGNDVALTESFLDNCNGNFFANRCIGDNSTLSTHNNRDGASYYFSQPHSTLKFIFVSPGYAHFGPGLYIKSFSWTNHPELVHHTLDEETAKQIAKDFALNNEELNKSHKDGGKCEYIIYDRYLEHEKYRPIPHGFKTPDSIPDDKIFKTTVSGIPYYTITNGRCTYDSTDTGHLLKYQIMVDANMGDSVFLSPVEGLD